jgi:uncharacterized sodium:solute symporter family permease YidK
VTYLLSQGIYLIQMVFVGLFALLTVIGIVLFFLSGKNPHKKRKAYLFTTVFPIGMLIFLYIPLLLAYYMFQGPEANLGEQDISVPISHIEGFGSIVYNVVEVFLEPIIVFVAYLGIFIWLMAAKNPSRVRTGKTMVFSAPFLWILIQKGPDIYRFFIS